MKKSNVTTSQTCIGIDLGDRFSQICVLDGVTKEVLEERRMPSTAKAFRRDFEGLERTSIAIEVSTHSPWISRLLTELGHEVIVANARKLRLIYDNHNKSDRVDAEYLARLGAADKKLLHPVRHRSRETQAHRSVLSARDQAVAVRTKLVNTIRSLVKSTGDRLPKCGPSTFHNKVRDLIPTDLAPAIAPLVEVLAFLHQQIRTFDKTIERLCTENYPETKVLQQPRGVGPLIALNYRLTIEDPTRFTSSRSVGSYLGLRPGRSQSSGKDPELRITKAGDPFLRRHLVQAAQYMMGPFGEDSDLRRWGLKLAARGGKNAKKRAVVAVARKLAVLLHRLWVTDQVYEPLRIANRDETARKA
jgi:transposase